MTSRNATVRTAIAAGALAAASMLVVLAPSAEARDGWNSREGWQGPGPGMGDAPEMDPALGVTVPLGKEPKAQDGDGAQAAPNGTVGCGETVRQHYDSSGNLVTTTTPNPC